MNTRQDPKDYPEATSEEIREVTDRLPEKLEQIRDLESEPPRENAHGQE